MAAARHAEHPGIALQLGIALRESGEDAEALVALQRAVEQKPDYAEAHLRLAECLRELERREEALRSLSNAVRLAPGSLAAWLAMAKLRLEMGDPEAARDAVEKAARLAEDDPEVVRLRRQLRSGPANSSSQP